jgi:hypothetical protein
MFGAQARSRIIDTELLNKLLTSGAALIALGVIPYGSMWFWVAKQQETWQPLSTRISLHKGQWVSPEFETPASTGYQLLLEMDRNLPFQRMECLLGLAGRNSDKECVGVSEIDDIDWTVRSARAAIARGSSRDISGGTYSNTISKILGHFEAVKGGRYNVVLDIIEDASELDRTNPRLVVQNVSWILGRHNHPMAINGVRRRFSCRRRAADHTACHRKTMAGT